MYYIIDKENKEKSIEADPDTQNLSNDKGDISILEGKNGLLNN